MNADKIVEELTFGELWWLMSSLPQDSLPEWGSLLSSGIFNLFWITHPTRLLDPLSKREYSQNTKINFFISYLRSFS